MLVKDILKRKGSRVITAQPDEYIGTVVRRFSMHKVGALVVTDEQGELLGVLSERDLVNGLIGQGARVVDCRVSDVMTTRVPVCAPTDQVGDVMRVMTEQRARHLPVVDGGRLCGLVSIGDAVKQRLDDVELQNKVLSDLARSRR